MLVVSDVVDVMLPLPEDLLVNLQESRVAIDALLDALPSMFAPAKQSIVNTCTGTCDLTRARTSNNIHL